MARQFLRVSPNEFINVDKIGRIEFYSVKRKFNEEELTERRVRFIDHEDRYLGDASAIYLDEDTLDSEIIPAAPGQYAHLVFLYIEEDGKSVNVMDEKHAIIAWNVDGKFATPILTETVTDDAILLIELEDGRVAVPYMGNYDSLYLAIEALKKRHLENNAKKPATEGT